MDETPFEQPDWLNEVTGILEKLNQGVIIDDACGRIVFANEIFLRMLGRAAKEIMGRPVTELFPHEDVPALKKRIEQAGDRVLIYTDGFSESFDAQREMPGVEGLSDIVRDTAKFPLAQMKQEIVDRVAAWRSGPAADDMSLVVVEIP